VKKIALANQTARIPTTTIYTPGTSGLFRISVYDPNRGDQLSGIRTVDFGWSDDAGREATNSNFSLAVGQVPPNAWGFVNGLEFPANVMIVEDMAGHPLTFDVPTRILEMTANIRCTSRLTG